MKFDILFILVVEVKCLAVEFFVEVLAGFFIALWVEIILLDQVHAECSWRRLEDRGPVQNSS